MKSYVLFIEILIAFSPICCRQVIAIVFGSGLVLLCVGCVVLFCGLSIYCCYSREKYAKHVNESETI